MSPDKWSAAAMFQATRMFASNMSEGWINMDRPSDSDSKINLKVWSSDFIMYIYCLGYVMKLNFIRSWIFIWCNVSKKHFTNQQHSSRVFLFLWNGFQRTYISMKWPFSSKVGCIVPMVIWSQFRMAKYWGDDNREEAPHFTYLKFEKSVKQAIRAHWERQQ